ncbi:hypothetical protein ACHAW6_004434 [Cyclotella cf. meneghiniana]
MPSPNSSLPNVVCTGWNSCDNSQLCAGLEAGIEGAIHAATQKAAAEEDLIFYDWEVMNNSWGKVACTTALLPGHDADTDNTDTTPPPPPPLPPDSPKDPAIPLLTNAKTVFQNLSWYTMLWEARHCWPTGSHFAYNLYQHQCRLILHPPPWNTTYTSPQLQIHHARIFPHSTYAGLVSCLMAEWQYICCIVPNIAPFLEPIEDVLRTKFLPVIFGPNIAIDNDLRTLLALRVKTSGVAIQNPTLIANLLFCTSQDATSFLSGFLLHNKPMCTHHHHSTVHTIAASSQKEQCDGKNAFFQALLECLPQKVEKCFKRAGSTGAWLSAILDRFSSTELTKTEWFDNIALQYGSWSLHLPSHSNGSGKGFTVKHTLNCKKGGLVGICHDDSHDEWAHLCSLAFSNE